MKSGTFERLYISKKLNANNVYATINIIESVAPYEAAIRIQKIFRERKYNIEMSATKINL